MSTVDRRPERQPELVERAARRLVALVGLSGHAEALGVVDRAAAVDRWLLAARRSPPVGSSQWLVLATCFAVLAGTGVEMATLLVAATVLPEPVAVAGLEWQPLLFAWTVGPPACAAAFLWWLRPSPFGRPASTQWVVDGALGVGVALGVLAMGLPTESVPVSLLGRAVTLYWPSLAGIAAIPPLVGAWLGLRCTTADSEVSTVETVALSTLPLVVVLVIHLLSSLPDAFI